MRLWFNLKGGDGPLTGRGVLRPGRSGLKPIPETIEDGGFVYRRITFGGEFLDTLIGSQPLYMRD